MNTLTEIKNEILQIKEKLAYLPIALFNERSVLTKYSGVETIGKSIKELGKLNDFNSNNSGRMKLLLNLYLSVFWLKLNTFPWDKLLRLVAIAFIVLWISVISSCEVFVHGPGGHDRHENHHEHHDNGNHHD